MSPALQAVSCIAGGFFYSLSHHGRLHVIIVLTKEYFTNGMTFEQGPEGDEKIENIVLLQ